MVLIETLPQVIHLSAYRGDTWAQSFLLKDDTGDPVDLTGATLEALARDFAGNVVDLQVNSGAPGQVTISQPAGGLAPGRYQYDVQVTGTDTLITTWIRGHLDVYADV